MNTGTRSGDSPSAPHPQEKKHPPFIFLVDQQPGSHEVHQSEQAAHRGKASQASRVAVCRPWPGRRPRPAIFLQRYFSATLAGVFPAALINTGQILPAAAQAPFVQCTPSALSTVLPVCRAQTQAPENVRLCAPHAYAPNPSTPLLCPLLPSMGGSRDVRFITF